MSTTGVVLQFLAAAALAVATFLIWLNSRAQLRSQLFNQRFAAYQQLKEQIGSVIRSGRVDKNEDLRVAQLNEMILWMFGSEVRDYVEKAFFEPLVDLRTVQAELPGADGEERVALIQRNREIMQALPGSMRNLEQLVSSRLSLA